MSQHCCQVIQMVKEFLSLCAIEQPHEAATAEVHAHNQQTALLRPVICVAVIAKTTCT